MGKIGLAFRAFFRVLFDRAVAEQVALVFRDGALPKSDTPLPKSSPTARSASEGPKPAKPLGRSDALTLLATLQREARLVDLIQEPLEQFQDAQVGAAARDVLRQSREVLARLMDLQPVLEQEEQSADDVPAGFDAARYRLTGNVHGEPPFKGTIQHRGWQAAKCQLPEWTGEASGAMVIAPAEVELR